MKKQFKCQQQKQSDLNCVLGLPAFSEGVSRQLASQALRYIFLSVKKTAKRMGLP
jgi:hypothetical protein